MQPASARSGWRQRLRGAGWFWPLLLWGLAALLSLRSSLPHPARATLRANAYIATQLAAGQRWLQDSSFAQGLVRRGFAQPVPDEAQSLAWNLYQVTDSGNLALLVWTSTELAPGAASLTASNAPVHWFTGAQGLALLQKRSFASAGRQYLLVAMTPLYPVASGPGQGWPLKVEAYQARLGAGPHRLRVNGFPAGLHLQTTRPAQGSLGPAAALLMGLGFVAALAWLSPLYGRSLRQRQWGRAIAWASLALLFRLVCFVWAQQLPSEDQNWFDASAFAAGRWLPSAGDALLHLILLIWWLRPLRPWTFRLEGMARWWALLGLYTVGATLLMAWARTMVVNSSYSFSVTQWLALPAVPALLVICWVAATTVWLRASFYLLGPLRKLSLTEALPLGAGLMACLALWLLLQPGSSLEKFYAAMGFLSLLLSMVYLRLVQFTNLYALVGCNALVACLLALYLLPLQARQTMAQLAQRSERHLGIYASVARPLQLPDQVVLPGRGSLAAMPLYRMDAGLARRWKDSVLNSVFGEVRTLYKAQLLTFDANRQPLFNDEVEGLEQWEQWYRFAVPVPGYAGLRYRWQKDGVVLFLDRLESTGQPAMLLVFSRLPGSGAGLYPALVSSGQSPLQPGMGIGYYRLGQLIGQEGDHYFPPVLADAQAMYAGPDYRSQLQRLGGIESLVIYDRGSSSDFLAIAAVLLLACLLLHFFFWLWAHAPHLFAPGYLQRLARLLSRTTVQLQLLILGLLLFAFFTVGTFLISRYRVEGSQQQQLQMAGQLQQASLLLQSLSRGDLRNPQLMQTAVLQARQLVGTEVTVFGPQGRLLATTSPVLYAPQYSNGQAHPLAMRAMLGGQKQSLLITQWLGSRSYQTGWTALLDARGRVAGLVSIPFLQINQQALFRIQQAQASVLSIFFITGLLALMGAMLYTRRLQAQYQRLGKAMQKLQAGERNEQLSYPVQDEVGELVQQYNQMVDKLDDSVAALRRNERQNAWKTMAQQVAHEIKNPLASMRLNLQFMQKLIEKNVDDLTTKLADVTVPVIEEIDHLAEIATNFAQYASVGKTEPKKFDLLQPLQQTIQLFSTGRNFRITTDFDAEAYTVFADEKQVHRVFNNLVKNALEAMEGLAAPALHISGRVEMGFVTLRFADVGPGLPAALLEKLFTPHFTTKSTGSGLGLAICRTIAEQWGGSLDARNRPEGGAEFVLRLPVVG